MLSFHPIMVSSQGDIAAIVLIYQDQRGIVRERLWLAVDSNCTMVLVMLLYLTPVDASILERRLVDASPDDYFNAGARAGVRSNRKGAFPVAE